MADPSGQQPPGGSMGHPNMRPNAPSGQYMHQGQPQHMMRPQVQQYINRPSPSYQPPQNQQMQGQFQRPPYQQHPMQGGSSQMAVGSPHSVNIGHKQQPHPSMINQHTNLSQFNTMGQGSPLNPQQLNSQQLNPQAAGSPYQMVQGSPAGVLPRYNSPQTQNPQMSSQSMQSQQSHQQMPSQQMPQQYSQQQQHQQNMQRYQQQQQQQMQSQQHMQSQQMPMQNPAQHQQQQIPQQHPSLSQQIPSPYQQQKSVPPQSQYSMQPTPPSQHSFPAQQQSQQMQHQQQPQQLQQPQQYPSQNSQQMHPSQQPMYQQKSPQVPLQYQQSPQPLQQPLSQSQQPPPQQQQQQPVQFAVPAPPQSQQQTGFSSSQTMLQQPSPIKQPLSNQGKVSTEIPKTTTLPLPSTSASTNSKSPAKILANKAINRRPAAKVRRFNPSKNLLMKPKASVLKHKKDDGGNVRKSIPKRVRWAPTLRVRHPQKFIRKRLRSRYLSPLSPPIMISGNEAKIATRLMQPIYYGELVVGKKTRKGLPPVRARLIGGKIVKPYTKLLSVMYAPKRQKPSRSALRRMANERSFTINREIECGERPPFDKANINLSQIPSTQPSLPNISLNESNSKEITKRPLVTSTKQPLESRINFTRRENLPFRRTFFPLSIKPQILKEKEKPKSPELSEKEKQERLETIKILNNIPWRTLPKKSKTPILPRIWHPPIKVNKDWIVLPKSHSLCRPIPIWHPPLLWPPKTLITKRKKIFKIDGKIDFYLNPSSNEGININDEMEIDDNTLQKSIRFATPLINAIYETNQEIDLTKAVFDPLANPSKSALSSKHYIDPQPMEEEENDKRKKKSKKSKNKKRAKSPPLVKRRYENPAFRVPSLRPPPPQTQEPTEPKIPVDLTKNPLNNQKKILTRLDEQKCVNLLYEYRLAQVRQTQPKNMWDANNQKMIELMKTKGAGIDSAVREDAGRALKFLEEKALKLTGKHSEIRNRLLQFCVDYGYEYSYEKDDSYFYLKIGDFTVQLELQDYLVKDAWFFWSNIEPIYAPHIAKMFCQEWWGKVHESIDRIRHIIPTSLTSEEKDVVLRALSYMERDLVRYYENVEFRSHIFALNDILVRTDIYPFSIILPRSPVEIIKNENKMHSALDKFEKVKNIATLQIQISPLERHKFCILSSLTPSNRWASTDTYKVGARFMIKFAKPIPIRYGAIKQLESIVGEIISKENYINVYKYISFKQHGREVLLNLSDHSKSFVMYFDFDQFDKETRNDTVINGFYIDKATQLISAMYIIKREYILNRLCESTCENNPDLIEWRYLCVKNKKIQMKIRLADIYDGHLCLYFQYRCYLVEARIIIRSSGNVGLGCLKIVHHGHKIDSSYHTVSGYQTLIDEWHITDPIFLNDSQLSDLNDVIQNTWHIPAFVDQLIKFIRNRCADDNEKEIHEFRPVFSSDRQYRKNLATSIEEKNSKTLKTIFKKKQKTRKSCKKDKIRKNGDENDDPSKDSSNRKKNPSKNGERRSSGKSKSGQQKKDKDSTKKATSSSSSNKNDGRKKNKQGNSKALKLKMRKKNGKTYERKLKWYFRKSIKNVLKRYKMVHLKALLTRKNKMITTTKKMQMKSSSSKKLKPSNLYRRFQIRRQIQQMENGKALNNFYKKGDFRHDRKRRSLLKPRQMIKDKHGSAWNDFVSKVNDNNEEMYKPQQKILTWPMLADQRVIHRFSNITSMIKGDPHMDEAGRIEEMDEYFNVSDCEESEQVCSYSYIPRKIVPPLPQNFRNMPVTIDNTIGRLKPQVRKYLGKFKLKELKSKTDETKSPEKEEEKENDVNEAEDDAAVQWGDDWKQEDFMEIYKAAKERPSRRRRKSKINHLLRPTSFKFISIINRDKQKSQGIFPYKVLRHAAICLQDGPYRGEPRKPIIPKSLIARFKKKFNSSKRRRRHSKKMKAGKVKSKPQEKPLSPKPQENVTTNEPHLNTAKSTPQNQAQPQIPQPKENAKPAKAAERARNLPRLKLKPLRLPPPTPLPEMTPSQLEDHNRVVLYFDQKMQRHDEEVYIEELRSRLMAIWIYFKPYITTARAFERMLEIYGPEAIYNQLQHHRKNLENEKTVKEQEKEFQRRQHLQSQQQNPRPYPLSITTHVRPQPIETQMFPPPFHHQNSASYLQNSNIGGNMGHTAFDPQNQFSYKSQDFFGDSSSSSAVSTPTSAGPLQSPFTPTGKRRGRGRRANLGTRMPSDQQLMPPQAKRGRPRKNPLSTPTSSSFGSSQESPLSRLHMPQSPFQPSPMQSSQVTTPTQQIQYNPMQQQNLSGYPLHPMNTPRSSMTPLQPSPLATQNITTPQKPLPQFPLLGRPPPRAHQEYVYESSSDEETDPPPPRPMPMEPQREPIKLKVDMSKVIVKPVEAKSHDVVPNPTLPPKISEKVTVKEIEKSREEDKSKDGGNKKERLKEIVAEMDKNKEKEREKIADADIKEKEMLNEKNKEKEREKERAKEKEKRQREKEKEKKKIESDSTVKLQKSDKKEKEHQKPKAKEIEDSSLKIKAKKALVPPEIESKDLPSTKKVKKQKSPDPVNTRSEKEKKGKEKREKEGEKERNKQLAEYEEERARKKRKAELRAEREKQDKEKTGKIEKIEKSEKSKSEKPAKTEVELEAERKKERREKKEKRRLEKEKLEKLEKEKLEKVKKRDEKEKEKPKSSSIKNDEKDKFLPPPPAESLASANLKKRRRSALHNSEEDETRDVPYTPALQMHRSPSKIPKFSNIDRSKIIAEQLAKKKKQKEMELAKIEKDKKRLGITPDIEPLPKKFKDAAETNETATPPKKVEMAQFFPEPGVLVEIPFNAVKTLHSIKSLLPTSQNPESTQKMIDRAKRRCLDSVTRQHPETSNILDNISKLSKVLEAAQAKQKQVELAASSITGMTAAASAGVSKEEAEKLVAEKEANLKTTQMRIQQAKALKEKEKKEKLKSMADPAPTTTTPTLTKNPNIGKSPLDSSDVLSRILDTKPPEPKKEHSKSKGEGDNGPKTAAARAAMAAAEDDALLQSVVGVPNLGEALKTFKIPKVQDSGVEKEEQPPEAPQEKAKEPEQRERERDRSERDHEKEKEKGREREREKEYREKEPRDRDDESDRDRGDRGEREHRESDRDRERRYSNNDNIRKYSSDFDRSSDRRYSNEGKYSDERRYNDDHDYHREEYPNKRGFYHHDRRGGVGGGGYQHRKHPRSPRSDSYDRRGGGGGGGHYGGHPNRGRGGGGGGGYRGGRGGGNYRDSRDHWKGSSGSSNPHDEFYEGLPPKQAQINREALDEPDYPHGESQQSRYRHGSFDPSTIPLPPSGFPALPTLPARKVLLPNRIGGDGSVRPSGWNHATYFNQPPPPPGGSSVPLPVLSGPSSSLSNKSSSNYPGHSSNVNSMTSTSSNDRQSHESTRRAVRARESRDSPPEVGLQIDESD